MERGSCERRKAGFCTFQGSDCEVDRGQIENDEVGEKIRKGSREGASERKLEGTEEKCSAFRQEGRMKCDKKVMGC